MRRTAKALLAASKDRSLWTPKLRADAERVGRELLRRAKDRGARQGTKIARVIELLQRDQGTRLEELIAATGWLPHTARAALTGLRHRGYDVRLERGETGRASVYRAVATLAASA